MDLFYRTERSRNRGETKSVFTALKVSVRPSRSVEVRMALTGMLGARRG
jgi:hypothetical protein